MDQLIRFLLVCSLLLGVNLSVSPTVKALGLPVQGYVYARGVMRDEEGYPFWGEYKEDGTLFEDSKLQALAKNEYAVDKVRVMSVGTYRAYLQRYDALKTTYDGSSEVALMALTPEEFNKKSLRLLDGSLISTSGVPLLNNTHTLIVAPPVVVFNDNTEQQAINTAPAEVERLLDYGYISSDLSQIILDQLPINVTPTNTAPKPNTTITDQTKTLLLKIDTGRVLFASNHLISLRTAFYSEPPADNEDKVSDDAFVQRDGIRLTGDKVWNPIHSAAINMVGDKALSDDTGKYVVIARQWYCNWLPNNVQISASIPYMSYNPLNQTTARQYALHKSIIPPCYTIQYYPSFSRFMPPMLMPPQANTFTSTLSQKRGAFDFQVDFQVMAGQAIVAEITPDATAISEQAFDSVEVCDDLTDKDNPDECFTEHGSSDYLPSRGSLTDKIGSTAANGLDTGYDFDEDGVVDTVVEGHIITRAQSQSFSTDVLTPSNTLRADQLEADADDETLEAHISERLQGVYLSSTGHNLSSGDVPDILRASDDTVSLQHEGLAKRLSLSDLKNTDVYLVRQATGQIVAERRGALVNDYDPDDENYTKNGQSGTFVKAGEVEFNYSLQTHGTGAKTNIQNRKVEQDETFARWQRASGVTPEFYQRDIDQLRIGEAVKIIAINRATGYIGTLTTLFGEQGLNTDGETATNGGLDSSYTNAIMRQLPDIMMRPPNLKIWAERKYTVEHGLTEGQQRHYLIGNEGAALNSDETVVVYSQWRDHDDSPLPEALGNFGYTGRLAILTAENVLTTAGFAPKQAHFAIKPGTHIELLRVSDLSTDNKHLYIQVNGEPINRTPSFARKRDGTGLDEDNTETANNVDSRFTSSPASDGIQRHANRLKYRPDHFVPFKTPVWDEGSSLALRLAYNRAKISQAEQYVQAVAAAEANNEEPPALVLLPEPASVYQWLYRPDYQYSLYGLELDAIKTAQQVAAPDTPQGEGETTSEDEYVYSDNLLDSDTPVISSNDDIVELLYELTGEAADLQPLNGFSYEGDKEQQLIFALGETEIRATVGANGQVTFDNLEHLASLSPEDLLTLRLYMNNDVANTLWEWAFTTLDMDVDSDNNNGGELPDRSVAEENIEGSDTGTGKLIQANNRDYNNNGILDYAEFSYRHSNGEPVVEIEFAPFVVEIPPYVPLGKAKISFKYSASDPNDLQQITVDDTVITIAAEGQQRIWQKNADVTRNPSPFEEGGDYLAPNVAYSLRDLGYNSFSRVRTFYIEGIEGTATRAAQTQVTLQYDKGAN